MKLKIIKRLLVGVFIIPVIIFLIIVGLIYIKQDAIVQSQISELNTTYKGQINVGASHIEPFKKFPYISIKIDQVDIKESKDQNASSILNVDELYIGFRLWDILKGNYDIQSLIIENGYFNIITHVDGTTNLQNALLTSTNQNEEKPLNIHLKSIELKNVDIHQLDEESKTDIETLIYNAKGGFKTSGDHITAHVDSELELNIIQDKDTTYFKNKHFEFHTDLLFNENTGLLVFEPSGITMENGDFLFEGSLETKNNMTIDMKIKGTKPSFDMFIAFAPTELIPVLERYDNQGDIFLNARLSGPMSNDRQPLIEVNFGAADAFLENTLVNKKIEEMGFYGHFTNGDLRSIETMEFSLTNINARLGKGFFKGNVKVKNFEKPDVEMQIDADFDLPFVFGFLNLDNIKDPKGDVKMQLRFHDIIDMDHPENALDNLNQAYYASLKVDHFSFDSDDLPAPLKQLDMLLEMKGKEAILKKLNLALGNSNLSITGALSDLPAIIHHNKTPVEAQLSITSNLIDLKELSQFSPEDSTGMDERIKNLKLHLSFKALANAFTEFESLPKGSFQIEEFYADLQNYPHTLHDFNALVNIEDNDLSIKDFSGFIDQTDFHVDGSIYDYKVLMQEQINGAVDFDLNMTSSLLKFENLFTYQGINYVPEEYRHEEIEGLQLHLKSKMRYNNNILQSVFLVLDKFDGKMHLHPLRFNNFNGTVKYENEHIIVKNFLGSIGKTNFDINIDYYLGEDPAIKKRDNLFTLKSDYIDFDALTNFDLQKKPQQTAAIDTTAVKNNLSSPHAQAYNIYELPFTDMKFKFDVDHFIYHKLYLKNIKAQLRTTKNHYIYIDQANLDAAGGNIDITGNFNGNDPNRIMVTPKLKITNVDLDQLLFKFENFGQDVILSENLHGKLNATITGNINLYPDLVANLDKSEVHIDALILNGRIENYKPVQMLADYFGDKNLNNIKFDTLQNHLDIVNGKITIPNMTIESTLGHMELSGNQTLDNTFDYQMRIPVKLLWKATKNKIFGVDENDPTVEEKIIKVDSTKRTRFLNISVKGTVENYDIKLGKSGK